MQNTDESKQINYLVYIRKLESKQIIIHIFYFLMSKIKKSCKNESKMTKNYHYSTLFDIIQHYLKGIGFARKNNQLA